ncbi:PAAR domain-containing protein [Paenibacillus lentus]|uniref:Uncharacterized protein n=1 Tax=Paenibacillus lentus TaxID=1338368 RepID=A0A3S8RVW2_9BACL|nr:PAAR domain-containing protein [Paenibacillus lentus]AZK47118.1 hypothetical protein EIM92_13915 [Paenibacillus lentus]
MPGVAVDGSTYEMTVDDYVTFDIFTRRRTGTDEHGNPEYEWDESPGKTNAKITGSVIASSKMKIDGVSVAVVGDRTNETWVASPPVPSDTERVRYRNISPGTYGSGQGRIISGSAKGKLGGQPIALIGSSVRTHLDVTTTIRTGNEKMKFSS